MAFAVGEECAYIQPAANANYAERNGNFLFGVIAVIDPGVDADVLWAHGTRTDAVPLGALDKINPSTDATLLGKVVRPTGPIGPELTGIVVRLYTRQPLGTGTETAIFALVQLLATGGFIEVLAAQLEVVGGR